MDYTGHAQIAAKQDALGALACMARQLCGPRAATAAAALYKRALLALTAAVVGAFGLSPARLPASELQHMLDILTSIYEGER